VTPDITVVLPCSNERIELIGIVVGLGNTTSVVPLMTVTRLESACGAEEGVAEDVCAALFLGIPVVSMLLVAAAELVSDWEPPAKELMITPRAGVDDGIKVLDEEIGINCVAADWVQGPATDTNVDAAACEVGPTSIVRGVCNWVAADWVTGQVSVENTVAGIISVAV
jgi:hypothetical protein